MRSPRPSNPELMLDGRMAFAVRRKIPPLFAEISDTMIAFRREVVGQIENAAGRIRQIGLGGMRCKAVEQQQVALLGRNLDELDRVSFWVQQLCTVSPDLTGRLAQSGATNQGGEPF